VLLTLIGTAAFALLAAGPRIEGQTLALILAIVMCSQVAIAVFNDICDQDLDAARTPARALPQGAIRQSTAFLLVVVSTGVCLTVSAQLGLASLLMVALGTGLGLAYSVWLKRSAWSWLPFAVAFPLLPAWIIHVLAPDAHLVWTLFVIGVPVAVSIHLADSIPDVEWDRRSASRGAAVRLGVRKAFAVCRILLTAGATLALAMSPLTARPPIVVMGSVACLLAVLVSLFKPIHTGLGRHVIAVGAIVLGAAWIGGLDV
jgi:4-hydroxybenzoate polyprenyltransferase